ncbi:MAG: hypothetical protein J0L62_01390 [Bacteroidetes bacterium]|nr:hypothetical protein [Bacteroidota bacterium]
MKKNILFISETVPGNTIASAVLMFRHFKWLEEKGHRIFLFMYGDQYKTKPVPDSWQVIETQIRKWWYPPYKRFNPLKTIRFWLLYLNYKEEITRTNPDVILSYLNGTYFSGFSAFLSKRLIKPLFIFYHDNSEKMNHSGDPALYRQQLNFNYFVLKQAKTIWAISDHLVYEEFKNKTKTVYPVSEITGKKAVWKSDFEQGPVVGFAGSLYNEILEPTIRFVKMVEKLNGKFIIFSPVKENVSRLKEISTCVEVKDVMPTGYVCDYLAEHCSSFLVNYPEKVSDMPWIDSNFPSKFTQFLQTCLPVLCQVPAKSAIGIWCTENYYEGYSNQFDEEGTKHLLNLTMNKADWQRLSDQSKHFSETTFNPESINQILLRDILDECPI